MTSAEEEEMRRRHARHRQERAGDSYYEQCETCDVLAALDSARNSLRALFKINSILSERIAGAREALSRVDVTLAERKEDS